MLTAGGAVTHRHSWTIVRAFAYSTRLSVLILASPSISRHLPRGRGGWPRRWRVATECMFPAAVGPRDGRVGAPSHPALARPPGERAAGAGLRRHHAATAAIGVSRPPSTHQRSTPGTGAAGG